MEVITLVTSLFFHLIILKRCTRFGFLSPIFLFFFHLFLAVPIRYLFLTLTDDYQNSVLNSIVTLNYFILIQVLIFSFCSYFVFESLFYKNRMIFYDYKTKTSTRWFEVRLEITKYKFFTLIILFFLSLSVYLLIMFSVAGGLSALIYMFMVRVSSQMAGLGYVGILSDFAIICSILIYSVYKFKKYRGLKQVLALSTVLISLSLLIAQGGRGNIIMYILSLLICTSLLKGKKSIKVKSGILMLVFVIGVAILGLGARVSSQQDLPFNEGISRVIGKLASSLSAPFAIYDHIFLSKIYAERHGYDFGLFYLENLVRPIPRSIWKDKPEVLGKKVRLEFWGDDQGGIPPGVIGESYISFGPFGLFFIGSICGLILFHLQKFFVLARTYENFVVVVSVFVPYFAFNLVRGGVDVGFTRLVIFGFMTLILGLFLRKKKARKVTVMQKYV